MSGANWEQLNSVPGQGELFCVLPNDVGAGWYACVRDFHGQIEACRYFRCRFCAKAELENLMNRINLATDGRPWRVVREWGAGK